MVRIYIQKDELDLDKTLVLGQVFGWEKDIKTGCWYKPLFNKMVVLKQHSEYIELNDNTLEEQIIQYLDIDTQYNDIINIDSNDTYIKYAAEQGRGIHILRQDFFEVTITFMISACNNMKRINNIVKAICRQYGDKVEYGKYCGYTFPTVEQIYEKGVEHIYELGMGFRAKNIEVALEIFKIHGDKKFKALDDNQLFGKLNQIPGIGPKVASCIMLFGDHRLNTFPVDTHIRNIINTHCNGVYEMGKYDPYNGIIQQYMFYVDTN